MTNPTTILTDLVQILPPEITSMIFIFLDVKSLCQAAKTCKKWREFIDHSDLLWKLKCLSLDRVEVESDRTEGHVLWKTIAIRNFGVNGVKKRWLKGRFSNPATFEDLPRDHLCRMSVDTWGAILEAEMSRSIWACCSRAMNRKRWQDLMRMGDGLNQILVPRNKETSTEEKQCLWNNLYVFEHICTFTEVIYALEFDAYTIRE